MARGKQFPDQAISLDPLYVAPHVQLAESYLSAAAEGMRPAHEVVPALLVAGILTLMGRKEEAAGHLAKLEPRRQDLSRLSAVRPPDR
jgi:hypothetical protein